MDREDFMNVVYGELADDSDNCRANRIINAADEYAESAQLGTDLAEVGTDCISRQAAIDICANAIDLWRGQLGEGALIAVRDKIKELPPAQPEQRTDLLKAEIKRMKRSFTICINRDYYTGYMSALSAVEGYIAKWEGDAK